MKRLFLPATVVCIILTSCDGRGNIPTAFPSLAPEPRCTATPMATPTLTSTPTRIAPTELPSTPTFTPFPPYHTKNVVFEYYAVGQLSYFDFFYADYRDLPKIILYDDGQMLVGGKQKMLSADETNRLLAKLDDLGFFSIESNQKHDQDDKLYAYPDHYDQFIDALRYCILVNADKSRNLCAYEPYIQFVIPEMRRILQYLDEYQPTGLAPYYPDRILLSIQPASPTSDDLPATATPWDNRFPSLDFPSPRSYVYDTPPPIMYIEGDMAREIYIFITNSDSQGVFVQDGKKYKVEVHVVLPHEEIINGYQ